MTTTAPRSTEGQRRAYRSEGRALKEPLQVRIPTAVKRRFKAHAAMRGVEPHELFVEIWEHYEAGLKAAQTTSET